MDYIAGLCGPWRALSANPSPAHYGQIIFDPFLRYLSRYTHRVAIANSRLVAYNEHGITFRYKDYRHKGRYRQKVMTLATDEFIRRFLLHVLPKGFHRIRHYGLFANTIRAGNPAKMRQLSQDQASVTCIGAPSPDEGIITPTFVCRACAMPVRIVSIFQHAYASRAPPTHDALA